MRKREGSLSYAQLLAAAVLLSPATGVADDIPWVGYQNGCGGNNNPDIGSFFHGDNWLNYQVPGAGDRAHFGTELDAAPTGYPNLVHFGDFCFQAGICGDVPVPGGTASFQDFIIRDDAWQLDFTPGASGCPAGAGTGALAITGGLDIGTNPAMPAYVTVLNGAMSMERLNVGLFGGEGHLTVQGGASVTSTFQFGVGVQTVGSIRATGAGTLLERSGCCDDVVIGFDGGHGTLVVENGAELRLGLGNHFIGRGGTGTMELKSGAVATFEGAPRVGGGELQPATGHVVLDGPATRWTVDNWMFVGQGPSDAPGTGTVEILGGAQSSCELLLLGVDTGSTGSLVLEDSDSFMDIEFDCNVGDWGEGSLTMSNGAGLEATTLFVGKFLTATGTMQMDGSGTTVSTDAGLFVGLDGEGALTMLDGATLSAFDGRIGTNTPASGVVSLGGPGTTINLLSILEIGPYGDGLLAVSNEAQVMAGGPVTAGGQGTGMIALDAGAIEAPIVEIREGGCLQGTGTIDGDLYVSGGKIGPGSAIDPTGTIGISGSLHLDVSRHAGSTLVMDLGGAGDHDRLVVAGDVIFDGLLAVQLAGGYEPALGDSLSIIEYTPAAHLTRGSDFQCFAGLDVSDQVSLAPVRASGRYVLVAGAPSGNENPIAVNDTASAPTADPIAIDLGANDGDADGDELRVFALDAGATHGTVSVDAGTIVTYVPDSTFTGIDSFGYTITDCMGGRASATVFVAVGVPVLVEPQADPQLSVGEMALRVTRSPFAGSTTFVWEQPVEARVDIVLFGVRGERVCSLVGDVRAAGTQTAVWDGRDDAGRRLPPGVYFARIQSGTLTATQRLVLIH